MGSDVYFANLRAGSVRENKTSKVGKLFRRAGFDSIISGRDLTAVKVHFGEKGGDAFVNPIYVREVVDRLKSAGAKPFITDSNTLYAGSRHNSVDHLETAISHGFVHSVVGAPLIISDGLKGKNMVKVEIDGKYFKEVRISGDVHHSDSLIALSHFKGHGMAGFGGAIKNIAMGGATALGKMDQHSARPEVNKSKCIGCGNCLDICPVDAPEIEGGKSVIVKERCIGCGECLTVCPADAIGIDWDTELDPFIERMVEYAKGTLKGKDGRAGFMNFLLNVTPDCDCFPWSDAPIVPDIGILASKDPVAIDMASLDLVNEQRGFENSKLKTNLDPGEDKFLGLGFKHNGIGQLEYGEEIGLGSRDYDLREI